VSNGTADRLQAADDSAAGQSATAGAGGASTPCSGSLAAVEVLVVGDDSLPIEGVAVALRSGTKGLRGKTLTTGICRFGGVAAGAYEISLYMTDAGAWEVESSEALEPRGGEPEAAWQDPHGIEPAPETTHTVVGGECVAQLAYRFGLPIDTIRDLSANAGVKTSRGSMHVLAPGDPLTIPAIALQWAAAESGNRYRIHRKGVPEVLRVRLLDEDEQPRPGVPYLAHVETDDERVLEDQEGTTDDEGFVAVAIPPNAIRAEVSIGSGGDVQRYELRLGELDPVETLRGVQQRLNNLGYPCGAEDGTLSEATAAALEAFQADYGLVVSGLGDEPTQQLLASLHLS
jgi:hypothetical protein